MFGGMIPPSWFPQVLLSPVSNRNVRRGRGEKDRGGLAAIRRYGPGVIARRASFQSFSPLGGTVVSK
jgi:hypothetical protein